MCNLKKFDVSSDIVMALALGMGVLGLYTHYVWYFMGAALLVFMAVMTMPSACELEPPDKCQ